MTSPRPRDSGRSPRTHVLAPPLALLVIAVLAGLLLPGTASATSSTARTASSTPSSSGLLPFPLFPAPEDPPPSEPTSEPTSEPRPATLTPAQLTRQLKRATVAADRGRKVPARTSPALKDLGTDQVQIDLDCAADIDENRHEVCSFGDTAGDRTVVLLGSSHMTMWLNGLEGPAERAGTELVGLFKFGCSPLVMKTWILDEPWPECAQWREWALDRIAEIDPDQVVVGTHTYTNIDNGRGGQLREGSPRFERAYAAGMRKLVRRLSADAGDVVVLGDTARRTDARRPMNCLQRENRRMAACEGRISQRTRAMLARDRRATVDAGGRFYDTNRLTCLKRRCPVAAAGRYTYRDFSHVSRSWAVHVGGVMAQRIGLTG